MTDYPEIKMCGADLPVLTTPQSETPRTDEDGCEDTDDALALILTGRHVDSQNIGELPSAALYKIRDLQRRLREAEEQIAEWQKVTDKATPADAAKGIETLYGRWQAAERGKEGMVMVPVILLGQCATIMEYGRCVSADINASKTYERLRDEIRKLLSAAEEKK